MLQCYHRSSEKNDAVEASLHILQQTALIQGKASKDVLFSGFPSYCFYHEKELFWSRILQIILQQCFAAWDGGGVCLLINMKDFAKHSHFQATREMRLNALHTEIFCELSLTCFVQQFIPN